MRVESAGRCAASALLVALLVGTPAGANVALTVAGSTTLLPLLTDAAQAYEASHDTVSLTVTGGGSRAAIARVNSKEIDMAASDVPLPAGSGDLVDHRIAVIAFAIAADPRAGVKNVTRAQAADIFAGRVHNWKELGGNDLPVVAINRPAASGVRELVAQHIMRGAKFAGASAEDESTSSLLSDMKSVPGAVGYASFASLRDSGFDLLALDGVAATDENVTDGTYPLWAFEHIVTNGPPSRDVSRFLAFLETNRTLLHRHGYIAIRDMNASSS